MAIPKKLMKIAAVCSVAALGLAACSSPKGGDNGKGAETAKSIKVAALESAYGQDGWKAVTEAFTKQTGIKVELQMNKNLEDAIGAQMKAGDYPDVVHLALGREKGLTETMVKDKALTDITDVLDMKVPGEEKTVKEKLIPGFLESTNTNPYGDDKTYLAPMFYTPTGFYYDVNLLKKNGWEAPTTWDEMWALGDKAKEKGISLFAYPTAGYFDAILYALLYEAGGADFFQKATTFQDGVWDTPEAQQVFDVLAKIASYTDKVVPAQANKQDFTKNQQLILDDKAIFMPNGDWVVGEMKDAPRADGFEWGNIALPAMKAGGDRYATTFFEQAWIPAKAKNVDAAKQFIAFLYSDAAAKAFASTASPAFQPITNAGDFMSAEKKAVYGIYDNGAKAVVGGIAGTNEWKQALLFPIDSLVSGSMTKQQWIDGVKAKNNDIRATLASK
ncbi:MAG: carbohydrate ABC transporter substrate-binding protein [Actinomycetaceae bacterium]|nr:carbohydrate ABC transporter substrate-binding protein [Arcanobacterium sp.]MDD7686916.1 carbohydrate ABC transporter substrate-binding protein [Actinomycetaceae bacterium]MDY5273742.1 carbohydrate ABC transporter substrate-binding protein [Arcanobacterium sp.]